MKLAKQYHIPITVRSGGLNAGGMSLVSGGIVVDLTQFKNISLSM